MLVILSGMFIVVKFSLFSKAPSLIFVILFGIVTIDPVPLYFTGLAYRCLFIPGRRHQNTGPGTSVDGHRRYRLVAVADFRAGDRLVSGASRQSYASARDGGAVEAASRGRCRIAHVIARSRSTACRSAGAGGGEAVPHPGPSALSHIGSGRRWKDCGNAPWRRRSRTAGRPGGGRRQFD